MPSRTLKFVAGEYYHLYNRGNNRQPIFFDTENYRYFLRQAGHFLNPVVQFVAYCLMPTHYHFLVMLNAEDLSHRMQLFSISYTKAINKRYNRVGALFQGAFQARHISSNSYLLHLSRYIHLNPVRAGLAKRAEDLEFLSFHEFMGTQTEALTRPEIVLSQFSSSREYHGFVEQYQASDKEFIKSLLFE